MPFEAGDPTAAEVDAFWAGRHGLDADALSRPGVVVGRHRADHYRGVMTLARKDTVLVSVPDDRDDLAEALGAAPAEELRSPEELVGLIGPRSIDRLIGPAWIGYLTTPPKALAADAHPLDRAAVEALDSLEAACEPREREHASIDLADPICLGITVKGELAAAASAELWGGRIGHVRVLVRPARRRSGYGAEIVGSLCAAIQDRGWLPQYRTLMDNDGSMGIAGKVGFTVYGTTISVRLR